MNGRTLAFVMAGLSAGALAADHGGSLHESSDRPGAAAPDTRPDIVQDFPYHPYNGRWTFARIHTAGGRRGWGRVGRIGASNGPGWSHDWPTAERNFSQILAELTYTHATLEEYGGNILTFDDPRLTQFPFAYVSEPGEWNVTDDEAKALRNYLLKGGFVMFDDFSGYNAMGNLAEQMKYVMPELDWIPLDGSEAIFDSFFAIDINNLMIQNAGYVEFYGLYLENDREKRMLAIATNNSDLGEFWEYSQTGFFPIDMSNEAYKLGINYVIYALTH